MQSPNSTATLAGLFKEVYGEKVISLAPTEGPLLKRIGFSVAQEIGNNYNQPVDLQLEHGITYGAANSTPTLLGAISGQMQNAQVNGSQVIGQALVNYEAIYKSAQAGKKAFIEATEMIVKRLSKSVVKRRELMLLHGQQGLGAVSAVSVSGNATITITDAEWSAGLWGGMKGAYLDMYDSTLATLINTNATLIVVSVNINSKQIVVSGNATDLAALAAGQVLFFRGASVATEAAGLGKILANTGTLFGISAATYELWGGNVVSSVGDISLPKILNAIKNPAAYGQNGKLTCVVSPAAFEQLNADEAALRRYDSSYRGMKAEVGSENIMYHCQTGTIEIMSHYAQKDGKAYIFNEEETKRIGSTDITFIKRQGSQDVLILESSTTPASEMRCFSQEALFIEQPRHTVVMTGITYP